MWGVDITNGTAAEQAPSPIPLDTGSWFVLGVTLCVFFLPLFVLFPPFPPRRSDALWQTHTKLRVAEDNKDKSSKSKLLGLFTKKAATSTAHGNSKGAKIKSLFVHPVDSLTGIEVTRAKVAPTGIEYDRLYTLAQLKSPFPVSVDGAQNKNSGALTAAKDHKWESITQRQFPLLATVQVELWQPDLDKLKGLNDKNAQSNSEAFLILRFPWRESGFFGLWELFAAKCLRGITAVAEKEILLPVGFPPAEDISAKGYVRNETVRLAGRSGGGNENDGHGEVEALDMSVELPEELRLYLGVSNKLGLFRATPSESEKALMEVSTSTNRKRLLGTGKEKPTSYVPIIVGFRDSYPVHIVNASKNAELEKDLETNQNGANVLVSGLSDSDELSWSKIKVKPDSSSQDADVTLQSAPKKSGLGVRMAPQFDNVESSHGFLAVEMPVEVIER